MKEDDNETEAARSCEGETHESIRRKKKKKKRKTGKNVNTQRSSEDNADVSVALLNFNFFEKVIQKYVFICKCNTCLIVCL